MAIIQHWKRLWSVASRRETDLTKLIQHRANYSRLEEYCHTKVILGTIGTFSQTKIYHGRNLVHAIAAFELLGPADTGVQGSLNCPNEALVLTLGPRSYARLLKNPRLWKHGKESLGLRRCHPYFIGLSVRLETRSRIWRGSKAQLYTIV